MEDNVITKEMWETFWNNVECLFQMNHISFANVAKDLGVKESYFDVRYLQNRTSLTLRAAYHISNLVGYSINELFDKNLVVDYQIILLEARLRDLKKTKQEQEDLNNG